MHDILETFVVQHRGEFDTEMPPAGIWARIEQQLGDDDTLERFVRTQRAAFDDAEPPAALWAAIESKVVAPETLETFVQTNRQSFDTATPSKSVWQRIEKQLDRGKTLQFVLTPLRIAAAVLLLVGVGSVLGYSFKQSQTPELSIARYAPEFAEAERVFSQKAEAVTVALEQYPEGKKVIADMAAYDKALLELQDVIESSPASSRPELVRQLIRQYQMKIEILTGALEMNESAKSLSTPKSKKHESL